MQTIRTLLVVTGIYLAWAGYQEGKVEVPDDDNPTPISVPEGSTVKIISEGDKDFPSAPTGLVATASLPIRAVLLERGTAEDAIKLARTFRGWAELLSRRPEIKTTADFHKAYVDANKVLFTRHPLAGKWGDQLNKAFDATISAAFQEKGLTEPDGKVKAVAWDANCALAAETAFNAISYQCFQAFLEFPKGK